MIFACNFEMIINKNINFMCVWSTSNLLSEQALSEIITTIYLFIYSLQYLFILLQSIHNTI